MAKSKLNSQLEMMAFWLLLLPLYIAPLRINYLLCKALGILTWYLAPPLRRTALLNLDLVYKDQINKREKIRIARQSLQSMTIQIGETIRLKDYHRKGKFVWDGEEAFIEEFKEKLPIVLDAHLGNWEMVGALLGKRVPKMYAIARVLDNPYLDREVAKKRADVKMKIIYRHQLNKSLVKAAREKSSIVLVMDQNAAVGGIFVPYFGHEASTMKGASTMARKYGGKTAYLLVVRTGFARYRVIQGPTISMTDKDEYNLWQCHQVLEQAVLMYPEQYLWVHPRYKKRPVEGENWYKKGSQ